MPDTSDLLLPRLPLRSLEDLVRCAQWVHEDRCSWMGDGVRPCTCGIPKLLRSLGHDEAPAGTGA